MQAAVAVADHKAAEHPVQVEQAAAVMVDQQRKTELLTQAVAVAVQVAQQEQAQAVQVVQAL
jgi:hypothetical protein